MDSRMRNICIVLILLVIVGLAACGFFWYTIRRSINSIYQVEASVQEESLHREQDLSLKAILSEIGPVIDKLSTRIIGPDQTVPFIDSLENLAKASGSSVSIDSVSVNPAEEGRDYEYLELSISWQGSWQHVYTFLSMIENVPYKVGIESVNLNQTTFDNTSADGKTRTTLNLWHGNAIVHFLKQK